REHVEVQAIFAALGGLERHELDTVGRESVGWPGTRLGDHRLRWTPPVRPNGRRSIGDAQPLVDGPVTDPPNGSRVRLHRQRVRCTGLSRYADGGESTCEDSEDAHQAKRFT